MERILEVQRGNRAAVAFLPLAIVLALLVSAPVGAAQDSGTRSERRACSWSDSRGWELNDGGKSCRRMARRFQRVVMRDGRIYPSASGCWTTKPGKRWKCVAQKYRTMNMPGDYAEGKIFRRPGGKWRVGRIRYS